MANPGSIGSRGRTIDEIEEEAVSGSKPKAKPPYTREATPERNDGYTTSDGAGGTIERRPGYAPRRTRK